MIRHDIVTPEIRSRMMRAVRQSDTTAELMVRKRLTAMGLRYRIRNRDLPGSPDIANRTKKWAVFVHGCFWHGHEKCPKTKGGSGARIPRTRSQFWSAKIQANQCRDRCVQRKLRALGYRVLVVWECQIFNTFSLERRLAAWYAQIHTPLAKAAGERDFHRKQRGFRNEGCGPIRRNRRAGTRAHRSGSRNSAPV